MPLDEQIALVAILAAEAGLGATVSSGGHWPVDTGVSRIARRLGRRLVRCRAEGRSIEMLR